MRPLNIAKKQLVRESRVEPLDEEEMLLARELDATRPRYRADCEAGPRPCPYLSCRHHLALEVSPAGSVRLLFPDVGLDEMPDTCALDVAARGGLTLDEVGAAMGVSKERIRQLEELALRKLGLRPEDVR